MSKISLPERPQNRGPKLRRLGGESNEKGGSKIDMLILGFFDFPAVFPMEPRVFGKTALHNCLRFSSSIHDGATRFLKYFLHRFCNFLLFFQMQPLIFGDPKGVPHLQPTKQPTNQPTDQSTSQPQTTNNQAPKSPSLQASKPPSRSRQA